MRSFSLSAVLRVLTFSLIALIGAWGTDARAQAPFTVEHLLQNAQIAAARFAPGANALVFEFSGPYGEAASFRPYARQFYPSAHRAALYVADLQRDGAIRPLFTQDSNGDYRIGTVSPGGRYLSYLHATGSRVVVATCEFTGRDLHEFDLPLDDVFAPLWISRTQLVIATIAPDRTPQVFIDRMSEEWRAARDGRRATASQVGSGRHAAAEDPGRGLAIVDARTGGSHRLAAGSFIDREISPDGKLLAAVRRRGPGTGNAEEPLDSFRLPRERTPLVLFDLARDGNEIAVSDRLDILPGSLGWSPDGMHLAFVARPAGAMWRDARLWTYDVARAVAQPVNLGSWIAQISREDYWTVQPPRFAWLGDKLVVEARQSGSAEHKTGAARKAEVTRQRRVTGWVYARPGATPLNLTAAFSGAPAEVIAASGNRLLVLSEGEVWAVSADARRELLTAQIDEPVGIWRDSDLQRFSRSAVTPVETLVLLTRTAQRRVLFLNPVTGSVEATVSAPNSVRILDVDTGAHRLALIEEHENAGVLSVADVSHSGRKLKRFNEHLRGVVGGQPVRLEHLGPDGRARVSWLLMPPGWRPTDGRMATVVQIYPGKDNWQGAANASLGSLQPFSEPPQLLAAHGYAVLMASVPLSSEVPRDTLPGLADAVLSAVDAAVSAGYADPDRLGLEGHSYGGYGTLGVIAQTRRFKAAIALSGLYDLIGKYGTFRIEQRMAVEFGMNLAPVTSAESGQEGMGAAPWRDPERYLRNSPLMRVEDIRTPVMLVHGDLDATVPMAQSEEMFVALDRLDRDAVFVRYWGEGHTLASPANIRDLWERKFAWYREYLGAPFQQ